MFFGGLGVMPQGTTPNQEGGSRVIFGAGGCVAQCDISTGTCIDFRILRVTPPRMNSRSRECP